MSRYLAPGAFIVGVLAIIAGAIFQASGAAAVVYCSVIGAGIILALVGLGIWLVREVQHGRRPGAVAS